MLNLHCFTFQLWLRIFNGRINSNLWNPSFSFLQVVSDINAVTATFGGVLLQFGTSEDSPELHEKTSSNKCKTNLVHWKKLVKDHSENAKVLTAF